MTTCSFFVYLTILLKIVSITTLSLSWGVKKSSLYFILITKVARGHRGHRSDKRSSRGEGTPPVDPASGRLQGGRSGSRLRSEEREDQQEQNDPEMVRTEKASEDQPGSSYYIGISIIYRIDKQVLSR